MNKVSPNQKNRMKADGTLRSQQHGAAQPGAPADAGLSTEVLLKTVPGAAGGSLSDWW